ncbi:protein-tyrosine phosphatase-like protein [Geopyxis carbonaria]|nr:protein-tyrosine phosphatase-like protein [Geopyxis carbonaria]
MPAPRQPSIPHLHNLRDVALSLPFPNPLKPRTLYRSAHLTHLTSPAALAPLNLSTILDLRTPSEIRAAPPLDTPQTLHISLLTRRFELSLLLQLPWHLLIWCLLLLLFNQRARAAHIIGVHVIAPKGLLGLTTETLFYAGPRIGEVMETLARAESWPALVHCTQGKDRTGIVVALLALLCGVGVGDVAVDYCRSEDGLREVRGEMRRGLEEVGLPEAFLDAPEGLMEGVHVFLGKRWGGVEGYLEGACGVGKETVERVRANLMAA